MAGHTDKFQLVELQPKTVYLPENQNATTGTFRRPGSTEDRDPEAPPRYPPGRAHSPPIHREAEYARVVRSLHDHYDGTGPRERGIPVPEPLHPVDGMKQPLLNSPVYLLVPTDNANLPPGNFMTEERYFGRPDIPMDGRAIRRRPTYARERIVEPYQEKSCCSCWRCMIALIVILTIIGLGLAITGIVFIKLIHQENQSDTVVSNATDSQLNGPRGRSAEGSRVDFDVIPPNNGTGLLTVLLRTTVDPNATTFASFDGNTSADFVMPVTGAGPAGNTTLAPNVTTSNFTSLNGTFDPSNSTDIKVIGVANVPPNGTVKISVEFRQAGADVVESATPNPRTANLFGVENGSAFDVNGPKTPTILTGFTVSGMAASPAKPFRYEEASTLPSVSPIVTPPLLVASVVQRNLDGHGQSEWDDHLKVTVTGAGPLNATGPSVTSPSP